MARRSSNNSNGKDQGQDQDTPRNDVTDRTEDPARDDADTGHGAEGTEEALDAPERRDDASELAGTGQTAEDASASDERPDTTGEEAEAVTSDDTVARAGTEASDSDPQAEPDDASYLDEAEAAALYAEAAGRTDEAETIDGEATVIEESDGETRDETEAGMRTDGESAPGTPSEPPPELEKPPEPAATRTVVERRGPGFVPLVLGGVVAAGLGYLASVYEVIPGLGDDDATAAIEAALNQQSEALASLQAQVAELGAAEPATVDLAPVNEEIAALGARLDETATAVGTLADRVSTLEERPIFSGDVSADAAAAAEALAAMEEQVEAQEQEAARLAAEAEAAEAEAAEAVARAEAEAAEARAAAQAEAALQRVRLAVTEGEPFAEPLGTVAEAAEIPEPLSAAADTGVASLEELQDAFPPAARDALPVAIRETAGEGAMDRLGAFIQGQVGGRAIEPREGDSPDAILSRAQAAVSTGDLDTALAEIAALPEGARNELADWVAAAEARLEVVNALDTVAQSLSGTN